MSSHHFVKEGQEPALVVAEPIDFELVASLLEWAPFVVVLEPALDVVLPWGIKVDAIIAEPSSVNRLIKETLHQSPIKVISTNNAPLIDTALNVLIAARQTNVHVCLNDPDPYFEYAECFKNLLDISFITTLSKWSFITSGKLNKWLPGNRNLTIRSKTPLVLTSGEAVIVGDVITALQDSVIEIRSDGPFWVNESLK
jgi:hypothetical protein